MEKAQTRLYSNMKKPRLDELVELNFSLDEVKIDCQHPNEHYENSKVENLLSDNPDFGDYDTYYVCKYESWVTVDFKGKEIELSGFGLKNGTGDHGEDDRYNPQKVTIYTWSDDDGGKWTELGEWRLDFNRMQWHSLKYIFNETIEAKKLKFNFVKNRDDDTNDWL